MMPDEVNTNATKQPITNSENVNERNEWKEFYYCDGKHEANIDNINRQLSVISTDIDSVKTKISELRTELKTEISELKAELKTEISELKAELKNDRGWIKGFIIATFFAFLGLIISIWLK
jgi:chromosome segregation ATPase